ncbi:choloylglycine hydrolase family protein [Sulfurimonas sp.]|uniref:choloylglycine hydrolase family protein n=1 Tax=Sulfurimonas sp. TaxID=2022749 RepID=UPI0026372AD9|nr:choloylglycine hydrolase family protein [Sulfurimonas sp.]
MKKNIFKIVISSIVLMLFTQGNLSACTGICLVAKDGGVVYGRTMEWGTFDLKSRVAIVPRGFQFVGSTPDGLNGIPYKTKYGFVGLDMIGTNFIADGLNEKGLAVGMFYFSGEVEYAKYEKKNAKNCLTSMDISGYILSQFSSVKEVREKLNTLTIVPVFEKAIGTTTDTHWMITDKNGDSIVVEVVSGKFKIFDAPLKVITNKPSYDWHMTNMRNYINLSQNGFPAKTLNGLKIKPTGHGTSLLGMPGDNTPPSRFVRAVVWTQLARELDNPKEAVYETFRILDNFQLPIGGDAAEGSVGDTNKTHDLMRSSTIWTTAWNLTDLTLNYHTQHNRRVRQLNMKKIDFGNMGKKIVHLPLDKEKKQDIENITPQL